MIQTLYAEEQTNLEWLRRMPKSFRQWLEELREADLKTLRNERTKYFLFRAQGHLEMVDRLLELEVELQTKPKGR